ncbi:MAG: YegP family protein [Actinomycetes bacterium]
MAGTFELFQDKAGKYRFRLKASNGQVVAASQAYESKASALNGIESVKSSSVDAPTVEVSNDEE